MAFGNGEKDLHEFRVKLRTSTAANLFARVRHRKGIAIGPVAQHGIESIGDGDDARPERNLFTAQAAWIACTIEELMVSEDDLRGVAQKGNAREHLIADLAVSAHDHFFGVVQRPWLAENFVGDGHFADVVKKSGASQHGEIRERNGNVLGNGNGVGSDALGVACGFGVFKVKSAAECFEGVIVRLSEKLEGLVNSAVFRCTSLMRAWVNSAFSFSNSFTIGLRHKHDYRLGPDPLGRVIHQVVTSLWKP